MHNGSDRRREKKGEEDIFKEIMDQNFCKNINLHIQDSQ